MARKDQTTQVNVRIPNGLLKIVDEDIEINQEFASRSDYIVSAIKFFEEQRTKLLAERAAAKAALKESEDSDFIASESSIQDKLKS